MMKRFISLCLCLFMILGLVACSGNTDEEEEDLGAYINMYLTDMVYDFDPAHCLYNESALKVVSLLFANLFQLDSNGKIKKDLVSKYTFYEDENNNEYKMSITLKDTAWSDGTPVSADNVVYTWKRILDAESSSEAAALLYDVKNARAIKHGDATIDDLGVYAVDQKVVEVTFEGKIDYDKFLLNLTSPALIPLPEAIVVKSDDWAKKPGTMITSGPFRVRTTNYTEGSEQLILERNSNYMRDRTKDAVDKYVTPYRLVIDYSMNAEQIQKAYEEGSIFFVGDIPLSLRNTYKETAEISDALSTHTYYLQTQTFEVPLTLEEEQALEEASRLAAESENATEATPGSTTSTSTGTTAVTNAVTSAKDLAASEARLEEIAVIENINKLSVLFRDANVRKALSLAIDRDAIAEAVVFAKAANALVPYGVFDQDSAKKSFRAVGGKLIETSADVNAAKALLSSYNTSDYTIHITVAAYDEVHMLIAEMVQTSWQALGFNVELNALDTIENDDYYKYTDSTPTDIQDDLYAEALRSGIFEVIALDLVAPSVDAFSILAPFAHDFAGNGINMEELDYHIPTHITGFNNTNYNEIIEQAFASQDKDERASLLHDAEKLLLEQMPVIPIIFNQNAYIVRNDLSRIDGRYANYFVPFSFIKAKLKNYELYTPEETEIVATQQSTQEPVT